MDIFIATVDTTALSVSAGSVTTVGTDQVRWCKLLAVTGGWIFVYHDSTGVIKGVGITVSGSTITAGAVTTLMSSMVTAGTNYTDAASSGATAVVVSMKSAATTCAAVAMQLSGTTIMLGAEATGGIEHHGCPEPPGGGLGRRSSWAAYVTETGPVYALRARNLSISGVTITAGTSTTSTTFTNVSPITHSRRQRRCHQHASGALDQRGPRVLVVSAVTTTPGLNSPLTYATGRRRTLPFGEVRLLSRDCVEQQLLGRLRLSAEHLRRDGEPGRICCGRWRCRVPLRTQSQAAPAWDGAYPQCANQQLDHRPRLDRRARRRAR